MRYAIGFPLFYCHYVFSYFRRMHTGEKITQLRHHRGLSQAELATKSFLSQSTISDIETGKASPTLRQLESLAEALEIPIQQLLPDNQYHISGNTFAEHSNNYFLTNPQYVQAVVVNDLKEIKDLLMQLLTIRETKDKEINL